MSRRKLSKQQSKRIHSNQQAMRKRADDSEHQGETCTGRIVSHHGKSVNVEYRDSENKTSTIACHLRANLEAVVTGDYVIWQRENDAGVVISRDERKNILQRPDSYGKLKPVAANITQLIIVIAPEPEAHNGLIDRYLVAANAMQAKPLLLVNKSDLLTQKAHAQLTSLMALYTDIGYTVLPVSARNGDGVDQLKSHLNSETSVFVGQSGVGKSSVIQSLLPSEELRIGDLSHAHAKGKHTTTHSQLYHFEFGGECIDSPGIREFGLWHMNASEVLDGFIDLRTYGANCKFRNCEHKHEPGCGLKAALEQGLLYKMRFDSYKHILNSLDDVAVKNNTR